ncbi:MAG: CBASS cGAMP-activated phospholipase [Candidatus Asgardarchaeia archaeon]
MKCVLSIDGGGIRGIIPALILAEIEKRTGKSVAKLFDFLAGTSTGGIIALGMSHNDGNGGSKYTAQDFAELYEKKGKEIFPRSLWKGFSSIGGLGNEKYSEKGLEKVLKEYFKNEPLGASLKNVLITSYDIQNREPYFFKSWRDEWNTTEMRLVARATSAAPTYFEPASIQVGSGTRVLIDGGVFVNNPAVSAYAECKRLFPDEKEIFVVSLGTGELTRSISYSEAKDWGLVGWTVPLLSCMFDGASDVVDYQMKQILGDSFIRLQTSLVVASDDMDNVTKGNIDNLKLEAKKLIKTHKIQIDKICNILG